jgi:hypothetical protein
MRALRLTDGQLKQLKLAAKSLPVEQRSAFLTLLVAHLELEGDMASAAAFSRALRFALDALHSHRDVA